MRRAASVDDNQKQVVAAFRKFGCSVQILSDVGKGVPDLMVGHSGVNHLVEIKDGAKPASKRKLTPDQQEWHRLWKGEKPEIVETLDDVTRLAHKWIGWSRDI